MSRIVAGRFDRSVDADAALDALKRDGFSRIGLAAGLIIGSLIGMHAVLLASGLGALVGAFAGVMTSLHGGSRREATPEHPVESRGGRMSRSWSSVPVPSSSRSMRCA